MQIERAAGGEHHRLTAVPVGTHSSHASGPSRATILPPLYFRERSVFAGEGKGKNCYMFRGWFPGSLEFVSGKRLTSSEVQCAAEGHDHCLFETEPATI